MGAAFAEGIASYLIGHRYRVEEIVHINPFQAADITTNADPNVKTLDYQNTDDIVINQIPLVSSPLQEIFEMQIIELERNQMILIFSLDIEAP